MNISLSVELWVVAVALVWRPPKTRLQLIPAGEVGILHGRHFLLELQWLGFFVVIRARAPHWRKRRGA